MILFVERYLFMSSLIYIENKWIPKFFLAFLLYPPFAATSVMFKFFFFLL